MPLVNEQQLVEQLKVSKKLTVPGILVASGAVAQNLRHLALTFAAENDWKMLKEVSELLTNTLRMLSRREDLTDLFDIIEVLNGAFQRDRKIPIEGHLRNSLQLGNNPFNAIEIARALECDMGVVLLQSFQKSLSHIGITGVDEKLVEPNGQSVYEVTLGEGRKIRVIADKESGVTITEGEKYIAGGTMQSDNTIAEIQRLMKQSAALLVVPNIAKVEVTAEAQTDADPTIYDIQLDNRNKYRATVIPDDDKVYAYKRKVVIESTTPGRTFAHEFRTERDDVQEALTEAIKCSGISEHAPPRPPKTGSVTHHATSGAVHQGGLERQT